MYGYIYKTTCLVNGLIYVGRHKATQFDKYYYGSGLILRKYLKKYGKENFTREILCECDTLEELKEKEKYWIAKLDARNKKVGINITEGGEDSDTLTYHPDKEKIIQYSIERQKEYWKNHPEKKMIGEKNGMYGKHMSGEKNGMYGKHHSNETKKKMSESSKIHWQDPEYRAKQTGENASCYGRTGEKHPMYGKHHSEEIKRQISESCKKAGCGKHLKGTHLTEEHKRKISEAGKGRKHSEDAKKKMSEKAKLRWMKIKQQKNVL